MSWVAIWTYRVRPGSEEAFARTFGRGGEWASLFSRSSAYLGTELFRDDEDPQRFATIDRWRSREDFERFRFEHGEAYTSLDRACAAWTADERRIGGFETEDGG